MNWQAMADVLTGAVGLAAFLLSPAGLRLRVGRGVRWLLRGRRADQVSVERLNR